jgi:hypothetical protein
MTPPSWPLFLADDDLLPEQAQRVHPILRAGSSLANARAHEHARTHEHARPAQRVRCIASHLMPALHRQASNAHTAKVPGPLNHGMAQSLCPIRVESRA